MRMENLCLGAHPGSLNKNLVARTRNLGPPGDRAPIRAAALSISQNHSIRFPFLVAIRRHFENTLVVSPQYGPRGIRWGDPQQGGGEGQV